ncbi:islet cell autoantigen 1 [Drosophila sulfurigaster albostrigata]|uniref:islet cell autoantigen 1 n=1 Tax=Drosophila sulfurigaster albostrigata TaxID=89887 RepID=UPI002D21E76C|nr:islet cell autoantigen 1 [Drosophila sulfurigaster albostrigata]
MLKSEVQHQYWITKKVVQRKLGSKEDKHIISSDAELDAKIEIFKSISDTSSELCKIIDQYQERLCILSQEECVFGRFLKEAGKRSKTTGGSITNAGKAMSFAGQQRMCVRVPLLRLQHEVDVYRCRAVKDTELTLQTMEKERTEYRAALAWMKHTASQDMDPDTGKGLDKFRTAQAHVRAAKHNFDGYSLDSIQKIDLLAAARCNMYSHALVAYLAELKTFAQKTAATFQSIANALVAKPKYDFCVLKELSQNEGAAEDAAEETPVAPIEAVDKDQSLFFAEDYQDKPASTTPTADTPTTTAAAPAPAACGDNESLLIELSKQLEEAPLIEASPPSEATLSNNKFWARMFNQSTAAAAPTPAPAPVAAPNKSNPSKPSQQNSSSNSNNAWLELFADLDPLANPQAFDLKLSGGRRVAEQT